MKLKLLCFFLLVSFWAYSQPTNYVNSRTRNRSIAAMFDSSLHIPVYCGVPVGLRVGSAPNDGALAIDTCNNNLYLYSGAAWIRANIDTAGKFITALYKNATNDSTIYYVNGTRYAIHDRGGGGGAGGGISQLGTSGAICLNLINDSTYAVNLVCLASTFLELGDSSLYVSVTRLKDSMAVARTLINGKLNISDTANMLIGYTRVSRFLDSLANHWAAIQSKEVPLTFQQSIVRNTNTVNLVNDQTSPGNNKVYGTDGSGAKGWKNDPAGGGSSGDSTYWRSDSLFNKRSGVEVWLGYLRRARLNFDSRADSSEYAATTSYVDDTLFIFNNLAIKEGSNSASYTHGYRSTTFNLDPLNLLGKEDSTLYVTVTRLLDSMGVARVLINGKISNITGLVAAGTNVTVTGSGTSGSPYVINSSGGGTPAGNNRNIQMNNNGAFGSPGSDSLNFTDKLQVKGGLIVTALPSGEKTDSIVTYNNTTKEFKKKQGVFVDVYGRSDGDYLQWRDSCSCLIYVDSSAIAKPFGKSNWRTGIGTYSPVSGDSTVSNQNWIGKKILVYRTGILQDTSTTNGYEFNSTTGTITVHPAWFDLEEMQVHVLSNANIYDIPLTAPPGSWTNLPFSTVTGGMTNVDSTWSFSGSTWNQYGLSTLFLASGNDGAIRFKYHASPDGRYQCIGFKTANTNGNYTTMDYGAMINPEALYPIESGSLGTAVHTASVGEYIVVRRTGTTVKIQTTTDNITYTDRYTFPVSSSTNLYIVYNVFAGQTGYYPKGINVQ